MNTQQKKKSTKTIKIWSKLLIGLLVIQAILELGIGVTLLTNFPSALESGFGITYNSDLDILGVALGLYLLLLTALMVLSSIWTRRANRAGTTLGIIIGLFLFVFGLVSFIKFGDTQAILVDGIRGLITIIFAYFAGNEINKN